MIITVIYSLKALLSAIKKSKLIVKINLHRVKVVKSNGMSPLIPKNNAEFSVNVFLRINP